MNKKFFASFFFLPFLLFSLLPINCSRNIKYKKIRLTSPKIVSDQIPEKNSENDKKFLRFAIAPVLSAKSSLILYEDLVKYVEKSLDVPIKIIQRNTYGEINELFKNKYCDVGIICTGSYVKIKDEANLKILAVPQVQGKTTYNSYIIVHKDNASNKFIHLKGKSFAFCDPFSLTGFFYPLSLLKEKNKTYFDFFSHTIFTYSHDNSIKAVAEKIVDSAAVDSIVYNTMVNLNDSYAIKTKIIESSPPFGIPPIVFREDLDKKTVDKMKMIFLSMHKNPKGRDVLNKILVERFVMPDEKIYDSVVQLMSKLVP